MTSAPDLSAATLVTRPDELLMVRHGRGPAGGEWDVPKVRVAPCETMAEAVVRSLGEVCGMHSGLCGPFEGWQELIDDRTHSHEVVMYFRAVLLDDDEQTRIDHPGGPNGVGSADEVRWISIYEVPELRTRDGLAEFLSDQSIIDTVI